MNISTARKRAVWDLYKKGIEKDDLILVTGFSGATIDKIINSERRRAKETYQGQFADAWESVTASVTSLLQMQKA